MMTPTEHEVLDPDGVVDAQPAMESVYFAFRIGGLVYALPPGVIDLVAAEQRPVPVPTVPPHVRGVVYVRGRIAAVVDMAMVLGIDEQPGDPAARRLVVVSAQGVAFAFVADEALGLWACPGQPARSDVSDRPVCGRFERTGTAVAVLDPLALARRVGGES